MDTKEQLSKIKALREQFEKESREVLKPYIVALFDKYPALESIGWRQFTPYFNDGDACEFGLNEFVVNDLGRWSWEDGDYDKKNHLPKNEMKNIFKELEDIKNALGKSVFLEVFGDHTKVSIERGGDFEIEEYDEHD